MRYIVGIIILCVICIMWWFGGASIEGFHGHGRYYGPGGARAYGYGWYDPRYMSRIWGYNMYAPWYVGGYRVGSYNPAMYGPTIVRWV